MAKEITSYIAHFDTLEKDILDIMARWENEAQSDFKKLNQEFIQTKLFENELKNIIDRLVEQKLIELFSTRNNIFKAFYQVLENEGFERDCIGCLMVEKHYGKMN